MASTSSMTARPVRIAHAHGNRREKIEEALRAPVDMIEADLWYWGGEVWVRHERRLPLLPLLLDRRPKSGDLGPWALPLGRWYLRLDVNPMPLETLVRKVGGARSLLLDLKGQYSATDARRFAERLTDVIERTGIGATARVCGQVWPLLDLAAAISPPLKLHYTVEYPRQWQAFLRRLERGDRMGATCIHRLLLDEERARLLKEREIEVFSWDVDEAAEAHRLIGLGVDGIISDDLTLLSQLPAQ